jgi:puromycin-sensitive aminopeptidase
MEIERESRGDGQVDPSLAAARSRSWRRRDAEDYGGTEAIGRRGPSEELRYLYALPDFRDPALIQRTVEKTLTGEIRSQNAPGVLARAVTNRDHGDRAWGFVKEHWAEIVSRLAPTTLVYAADGVRYLTDLTRSIDAAAPLRAPDPQSALQRSRSSSDSV